MGHVTVRFVVGVGNCLTCYHFFVRENWDMLRCLGIERKNWGHVTVACAKGLHKECKRNDESMLQEC